MIPPQKSIDLKVIIQKNRIPHLFINLERIACQGLKKRKLTNKFLLIC